MISAFLERHKGWLSAYTILTVLTVYLYGGLVTMQPIQNHETPNLYFRTFQYLLELRNHGFPASLFPDAIDRGGFAFPLFYPPLSYLFASALAAMLGNYYLAGNLALFFSVLFSAYTAYYSFSRIGKASTALAASVLYIAAPYRFIDVVARGALAECWTFVWFPLIFCSGILFLRRDNRLGFALLSVSMAALVLSHAVMAIYFIGMCVGIFLIVCILARRFAALGYSIAATVCAAGLSAWYIVPQRMLWSTVKASDPSFMWAEIEQVNKHKVDFSQFWFSDPTRWGGGSTEGVVDGMSFELGHPSILVTIVIFLSFFWLSRRHNPRSFAELLVTILTIVCWMGSILFCAFPKLFLESAPTQLLFIQFGWRMLGITAFFCAAGYARTMDHYRIGWRIRAIVTLAVIIGSIASIDSFYKMTQYLKTYPPEPLTAEAIIPFGENGFVEISEYLPKSFLYHERAWFKKQESMAIGDMDFKKINEDYQELTYEVNARTSSTLLVPKVAYPVYAAETQHGRRLDQSDLNGLLIFEGIQPGDTTIRIFRVLAPSQKIGLLVSGATIAMMLVLFFLPIWNVGRNQEENQEPT